MANGDRLADIQQAHHRRLLGLQGTARQLVGSAWDTFAGLDVADAARFVGAASVVISAVKAQTSTLAVGYMAANDRVGGFPVADLLPTIPMIRGGVATEAVYQRSIVTARTSISRGHTFDEAMAAGRARAVQTAATDVVLTNRQAMAEGAEARPWVVGYRRVLTGDSCAFCATASTQRYRTADLLPLHPACDCDVAEILGTADPGQIINRGLLNELKDAAAEEGRRDYWNGKYVVDENGNVRHASEEKLDNGSTEIAVGDKVVPEVVEHGELGPVLTDARHGSTLAGDVAAIERGIARAVARSADEVAANMPRDIPAPRRTRAKVSDPNVLAEARRRNVSPERVIELREAKAARRFAEDKARREAAKALTADSADVVRVARKFGVSGDEVLTARHRLGDVRAAAREVAARTQRDALAELDRLGVLKLKNPPKLGARTGTGSAARRGEWDWLEQVSDREKARLSREWYGGTLGPDQVAHIMSEALGKDLSVGEAMERWLELNRTAEAAGALRRGKLPSSDAYSGAIDADDLIGPLADDGYDAATLFGDELDAAAHIAGVERQLVADDAFRYLGDAANAQLGPAPYRMGYQAWEEEVRTLEFAAGEGTATATELARLAELVPEALDDPGVDFEELYARIVTTARKAGEEVPDHAVIPWA